MHFKAVLPFHVVGMELVITGFGGADTGVLELDMVTQIDAVSYHG
jgi:hypothetical protein